ncbi:MAG: hypothetical protein K5696_11940, partial [Lachnospiraceae bacterium]|nr:hypothetical protein [Lachnospiraceae bacterium]
MGTGLRKRGLKTEKAVKQIHTGKGERRMDSRKWKTGCLSALLALSMSLSMLPAPVLAAETTGPDNTTAAAITAETPAATEAAVTDDTSENTLLPSGEQEADVAGANTIAKADTAEEDLSGEEAEIPEPVDIALFNETINKSYTLTSNRTISGDLLISADVDLAGYTLTVTGNLQHTNGNIRFNNGTLSIDGDYIERSTEVENGEYKDSWGKLYFENAGDSMIVNGDFIAKSCVFGWLMAGKLEVKGDLTDYTGNTIYADYNTESTHVTTFSGTGKQVVDLKNDHCFHIIHTVNTNVQFKKIGFETMDQNVTLTGDVSDMPDKLDLNGKTLTVNGNVTKHGSSDLHLAKGTLHITGNFQHENGNIYYEEGSLKIDGSYIERSTEVENGSYKDSWGKLYFENEKDSMVVGGDFIAQSCTFGWLKAGTLECKGNVTDYTGNTIYADYNTESTHVTIFSGTGTQVVDLQKDHCFHIIHTP